MTGASPLQAAREQLAYWQKESEAARQSKDGARLQQCERFIAQCQLLIEALESVQKKPE
jgi:hypothetical protein